MKKYVYLFSEGDASMRDLGSVKKISQIGLQTLE